MSWAPCRADRHGKVLSTALGEAGYHHEVPITLMAGNGRAAVLAAGGTTPLQPPPRSKLRGQC
jgi:hypothetical protein